MSRDLISLAERVETATGPDRDIDALIALAVVPEVQGWVRHPNHAAVTHPLVRDHLAAELWPSEEAFRDWRDNDADVPCFQSPRYTASIDAAMTLVPEGMVAAFTNCDCTARTPDFSQATAIVGEPDAPNRAVVAATPALALTAAALRARAASETSNEGSPS